MNEVTIVLPQYSMGGAGLISLLSLLSHGNGCTNVRLIGHEVVDLDVTATVALLSVIHAWRRSGCNVEFNDEDECLRLSGVGLFDQICPSPRFPSPPPACEFCLPVQRIGSGGWSDTAKLANSTAQCLIPGGDEFDEGSEASLFSLVEYAVSELANNLLQHSRGFGFILADRYSTHTAFAIADCGIGIRRSFQESGSPHWSDGMTDLDAIEKALQPRVSCKSHQSSAWGDPPNAGVGLTLLKGLAQNSGGSFFMVSGSGFRSLERSLTIPADFPGTLCSISIDPKSVSNFPEMMYKVKEELGLVRPSTDFDRFFE